MTCWEIWKVGFGYRNPHVHNFSVILWHRVEEKGSRSIYVSCKFIVYSRGV